MKTAAFRVDASSEIGTGHVMRCAALAARMISAGVEVAFVSAALPQGLSDWLRKASIQVLDIPMSNEWRDDSLATRDALTHFGEPDLLVVDHYRIEHRWETSMRPYAGRIMVIDDLANRPHDCDLFLDQNLHDDAEGRYRPLLPCHAKTFFGPRYALLRAEFDGFDGNRSRAPRKNHNTRLLVFFGGTDPGNQTLKVIDALRSMQRSDIETTIVLGPAHPDPDGVLARSEGLSHVHVMRSTESISNLMSAADLAIGTCGIAAWERCVMGLPTLVVVTAENQREDAVILDRLGAIRLLGDADDIDASAWAASLTETIDAPDRIRSMSQAASAIMANRRVAVEERDAVLLT